MDEVIRINSALDEPGAAFWRQMPALWRALRGHAHLLWQLTRRDSLGRYQGSHLGVGWSLINPLMLLAVESVVFGLIFNARFTGHPSEGPADYALALFGGLMVFNVFAETLTRAPMLIVSQPNYVTKVVFPLEILSVTQVLSALITMCLSLAPMTLGLLVLRGHIVWTFLLWPVLLPPLLMMNLGLSWALSTVGVFFRDLNASIIVILNILMYGSAIFYPISKVPPAMMPFVRYNPLAWFVDQSRNLLVWGVPPDAGEYALMLAVSASFLLAGHAAFTRARRDFADEL